MEIVQKALNYVKKHVHTFAFASAQRSSTLKAVVMKSLKLRKLAMINTVNTML